MINSVTAITEDEARLMFRKTDLEIVSAVISELTKKNFEYLNSFYAQKVFQLNLDDAYFHGIRANTFCIELGWSEYLSINENANDCYVITANHKGLRFIKMYQIEERKRND